MSVDTRIREALRAEGRPSEASTQAAYGAVVTGARRRIVARRTAVGTVAAVAALVAGITLAPHGGSGPEPAPPAPTPTPTLGDHTSTSELPYGQEPLDGRWQTRPLTRADIAATLRAAGLARFAGDYAATFPKGRFRIQLTSFGGNFLARVHTGDGDRALARAFLHPEGHRLTLSPGTNGFGSTTFRWSVAGDQLTLTFQSTSGPDFDGFPAEVRQRALYTTAPFVRR